MRIDYNNPFKNVKNISLEDVERKIERRINNIVRINLEKFAKNKNKKTVYVDRYNKLRLI